MFKASLLNFSLEAVQLFGWGGDEGMAHRVYK